MTVAVLLLVLTILVIILILMLIITIGTIANSPLFEDSFCRRLFLLAHVSEPSLLHA